MKVLSLIAMLSLVVLSAASLNTLAFNPVSYRLDTPVRDQVITSTLRSWSIDTSGLTTKKLHILGEAGTLSGTLFVSYTMMFGGDALDTGLTTIPLAVGGTGTAIMTVTADFPVMNLQANVVSTQTSPISLTIQFYGHD